MTIEYFWLEAIWILALIFANGFFAASEIAVITMKTSWRACSTKWPGASAR